MSSFEVLDFVHYLEDDGNEPGQVVAIIDDQFQGWVDAGLEDRDDLRSWNFEVTEIDEVTGDPEGYDS